MHINLLLAFRFLRSAKKEKNINSMIKICVASIFISTFALTLISAIMNGFEKVTYKKIQGIHSDIIIQAEQRAPLDYLKLKSFIMTEFKDSVTALSPSSTAQVIVKNKKKKEEISNLVIIKGVSPKQEPKVNKLKKMMIKTEKDELSWPKLLKNNRVFIGDDLAKILGVTVGNQIDLLYTDEDDIISNKICLNTETAYISGIFKTGINEFDEHVIFSSLDFFEELFSTGITDLNLKLKDSKQDLEIIKQLKEKLNLVVFSWKDLYPALISALTLEKYATFFILILVTIVAGMNLISLLFMFITQKQNYIALLKAMGMSENDITKIFVYLGMAITLSASFLGLVSGSIISWIINKYNLIRLPDAYYVSYLPTKMDWNLIILIIFVIIVLSFLISIIPTRKIKDIHIAQILKGELS